MAAMLLSTGTLLAEDKEDDAKRAFQGTWTIVERKEVDDEPVTAPTVVIEGDKYKIKAGDKVVEEGTFTVDGTKKNIEVAATQGQDKGNRWYGVYEIDGDNRHFVRSPGCPGGDPVSWNPEYVVRLTTDDRRRLVRLVRTGRNPARVLTHAQVLLKADAEGPGLGDEAIATALDCGVRTVARVRKAFAEGGLDAAVHRKKSTGRRYRNLDGEQEARLIALACSTAPDGRGRWTLKLLADRLGELRVVDAISDETVRRTLKKTRPANVTG